MGKSGRPLSFSKSCNIYMYILGVSFFRASPIVFQLKPSKLFLNVTSNHETLHDNLQHGSYIRIYIYTKYVSTFILSDLQLIGSPKLLRCPLHLRPKARVLKLHWSSRNLNETKMKNLWVALGRCTNFDISLYMKQSCN